MTTQPQTRHTHPFPDRLFYDLAVAIAFGLAFATIVTLGLLPVLYATVLRMPSRPRSQNQMAHEERG
jgi:Cu/Ag efflux pump CusA